jgi:hypothetical protein
MLAWIWNVRDDPVNPFQRIEGDEGDAGARIGGSLHGEAPIRLFFERVHGQARTGDLSGLGFERLCLAGIDGRSSKRRKAGMSPGEEVPHEGLGKTFGLVKTLQKEAPEDCVWDGTAKVLYTAWLCVPCNGNMSHCHKWTLDIQKT